METEQLVLDRPKIGKIAHLTSMCIHSRFLNGMKDSYFKGRHFYPLYDEVGHRSAFPVIHLLLGKKCLTLTYVYTNYTCARYCWTFKFTYCRLSPSRNRLL